LDLTWSDDWKNGESAQAVFKSAKGTSLQVPIIPNRFPLKRATDLKIDGDLGDWLEAMNLPDWMLGSTSGNADARFWLAWAPEGLYGSVEVKNSKAQMKNPREFWEGDSLELFLATDPAQKNNSIGKGDQQFWFAPLFGEKRIYAGQWKLKDEIPANIYDIPGLKSAVRKTADGYIMEFLLPAGAFQHYAPHAGEEFGVTVSLTVRGLDDSNREVFWPRRKDLSVRTLPLSWGRMKLTE
jgi:hypothetical protein